MRMVALAIAVALVGCGGGSSTSSTLPHASGASVHVRLPWRDGGAIPRRFTCDGADVTPRLEFSPHSRGYIAVMQDLDANGFVHWLHWDSGDGRNSFGHIGYGGPCPPKGDAAHRYRTTVFVLDAPARLMSGADANQVVAYARKHARGSGSVTATYARR